MAKFMIVNKETKKVIRYGDCAEDSLQYQVQNENEELVLGEYSPSTETVEPVLYSNVAMRYVSYPNQYDQLGALFKFVKYMIEEKGMNPPQEVKDMVAAIDQVKATFPK